MCLARKLSLADMDKPGRWECSRGVMAVACLLSQGCNCDDFNIAII